MAPPPPPPQKKKNDIGSSIAAVRCKPFTENKEDWQKISSKGCSERVSGDKESSGTLATDFPTWHSSGSLSRESAVFQGC